VRRATARAARKTLKTCSTVRAVDLEAFSFAGGGDARAREELVVPLRELRALLAFAEAPGTAVDELSVFFSVAGAPVLVSADQGACVCVSVLVCVFWVRLLCPRVRVR
jgi:hypothetical protein